MSIKDQLNSKMKTAMKAKDQRTPEFRSDAKGQDDGKDDEQRVQR